MWMHSEFCDRMKTLKPIMKGNTSAKTPREYLAIKEMIQKAEKLGPMNPSA